jgi:hypothetical protein
MSLPAEHSIFCPRNQGVSPLGPCTEQSNSHRLHHSEWNVIHGITLNRDHFLSGRHEPNPVFAWLTETVNRIRRNRTVETNPD